MKRVLIVAPHPDDETLGAGGTLLRHRDRGDETHWLIVTSMRAEDGFSPARIETRAGELDRVEKMFGFKSRHELGFPAARLDTFALADLVRSVADVVADIKPNIVYLPYPGDAHSDHNVAFSAASATLKWFRAPFIERVFAYETPSETGFNLDPLGTEFRPNWHADISSYLEEKIRILSTYESEIGTFPFPRSLDAVRHLAKLRGSQSGFSAAEAFILLKGIDA